MLECSEINAWRGRVSHLSLALLETRVEDENRQTCLGITPK